MNKLFKILTASVMLIAMLVISGCGGGDNFEGNWVTIEKNKAVHFDGNYFTQLKIEKNGDSYLLTKIYNKYDLKEDRHGDNRMLSPYDGIFVWETDKPKQNSAKADGENRLIIDGSMGTLTVVYIEKDDVLLIGEQVYHKEKEGEMQKFKEEEQKRLQSMYDAGDTGFNDKLFMKSISFSDTNPIKK